MSDKADSKDGKKARRRSNRPSMATSFTPRETILVLAEGQVLAGRYLIIEKAGTGGMGVVYKVEDLKLENRVFALKALPPDMAGNSAAIKRLKKEALAAIELHHPNITALHSFETDGDHAFLIMEYLNGPNLEDRLIDDGPFSLDDALDVARQICPALDYAHKSGVIHRDIKPANLLFANDGASEVVKIADFGIAFQIRNSVASITGLDTSGGTMSYMPPEQLAGKDADGKSDQYALAATLYELLRGRPPFQGSGAALIHQIERKAPDIIENVSEQVNNALLKGLAKKREERFESCSDFLKALEGNLPAPLINSTEKSSDRSWTVGVLVVLLLVIYIVFQSNGDVKGVDVLMIPSDVERLSAPTSKPSLHDKGKRFTLAVNEIDIRDALQMIGRAGKFNVALGRGVRGKISVDLKGVDPLDALNILAVTHDLALIKPQGESNTYIVKEGLKRPVVSSVQQPTANVVQQPAVTVVKQHRIPAGTQKTFDDMFFCWIPSGEFLMGSPLSEARRRPNEGPQHRVQLTAGFWIGKYEVSQKEWKKYMGTNPSQTKGDDLPVCGVSWNDCDDFLVKLNSKSRTALYRLPTEAEWEYACRAGTETPFHNGRYLTTDLANFNGSFLPDDKGLNRKKPTPCGSFQPNGWGLSDMHGNALEWCIDWSDDNYYSKSPTVDPCGPAEGKYRILRGGSWDVGASRCRSAYRVSNEPTYPGFMYGFRLVLHPVK